MDSIKLLDPLEATNDQLDEQQDFNKLRLMCQKKAIQDKLTAYYRILIDNEVYNEFSTCAGEILTHLHEVKQQAETIHDTKHGKAEYCFFTINMMPNRNNMETIESEMDLFLNKCKFTKDSYMYSIEQRSEDVTRPHGHHVHVLFNKNKNAPSKIQRAFTNHFYPDWIGSQAALDWKYIKDPDARVKYIMGDKHVDKMSKVHVDRQIRDTLGLSHYKVVGDFFKNKISLYITNKNALCQTSSTENLQEA